VAIKRAFRRRAAVEPVIGHLKTEHRLGRNHLIGSAGDAINAVLAAVGYNFRLLLKWLAPGTLSALRPWPGLAIRMSREGAGREIVERLACGVSSAPPLRH
jgi:transposase, IS5 family